MLRCQFRLSGFRFHDGTKCLPCEASYHIQCFRVGQPFSSRRKSAAGLVFPPVRHLPKFICECCTVRAVLDRELTGSEDWKLLCYERMRILDIAHSWSLGTHKQYQGKLDFVASWDSRFGTHILQPITLRKPPDGPEIPLMWLQEEYSLRPSPVRKLAQDFVGVSVTTVRQFRSAVSMYLGWDTLVSRPDISFLDQNHRLLYSPCRATDNYSSAQFAAGFRARLGEDVRPSVALQDRHVRWLDQDLDGRFRSARKASDKALFAMAGLANLSLWLGWLRSRECFDLCWSDVTVVRPEDSERVDLPPGTGMVTFDMQPETKSSRATRVDVLMAYCTLSGLNLGRWVYRAQHCCGIPHDWTSSPLPVFRHANGTKWTSHYFRHTFLYPALRSQRAAADAFLLAFDDSEGNRLEEKFWSLHCYRRGARTQATRGGQFLRLRFRKATEAQVYEHARWRRRRSGEKIDVIYRDWPLVERLMITLYSQ